MNESTKRTDADIELLREVFNDSYTEAERDLMYGEGRLEECFSIFCEKDGEEILSESRK